MRRYTAIVAGTRVDLQGEEITLGALQRAAETIRHWYIPLLTGHDPDSAPVGRVVGADVVPNSDGSHSLEVTLEVWDENDSPLTVSGDGRSLVLHDPPPTLFAVRYNLAARDRLGIRAIADLAHLAGADCSPHYEAQKGLGEVAQITLLLGKLAVGAIAAGFLAKLGEDLYRGLKSSLRSLAQHPEARPALLIIETHIKYDDRLIRALILLPDPTPSVVDDVLGAGLRQLDRSLKVLLDTENSIHTVVFHFRENQVGLKYWIRSDGFPSPKSIVQDADIRGLGFSIGALVRGMDAQGVDDWGRQ